jgi:hypothetical protein
VSRRTRAKLVGIAALALTAASCEPSSITAARQQLGRGPARIFQVAVPINQDTLNVGKFLGSSDTTTTSGGLLGLAIAPESLGSAIGQKLQFASVAFQPFTFSYAQMLSVAPESSSLSAVFPVARPLGAAGPQRAGPPAFKQDTLRFATAQGSGVTSATVGSGSVIARITNHTSCTATIADSVQDSTGATILGFPSATLAPGATATDTADAAGKTFAGYLKLGTPTIVPQGLCLFASQDSIAVGLSTTTLTLASVTLQNLSETFTQSYAAFAGQADFLAVDTVIAYSGTFALTFQNRLPVAANVSLTLNGVTKGGVPLSAALVVPAAPGNGTTVTSTKNLDLSGYTIRPAAVVAAVTGNVSAATATITPTVTTNAEVVSGTGSLVIQAVAGKLDPATTPELTVPVLEYDEVPGSTVNFGDLKEAVLGSHLNNAIGTLTIRNTAQTPVTLSAFTLGVVRLNASGQPLTDGLGNPLYEKDSTSGQPILVNVVQPGKTTVLLPRASTTSLTLQMAPLVDRLVHLLLTNVRAAVVAAGTASAGDGAQSRITRSDSALVKFGLTVGLDVTLPDTGVVFTRTEVSGGADLKSSDSSSVVSRLVDATVTAVTSNGTPLGVTLQIAIIGDSLPNADVFTLPGALQLGPIAVGAAAVDSAGRAVAPTVSTDSIRITGAQSQALLERNMTTTVRIRLMPPAAGKRSAVGSGDRVIIISHADVRLSAGGGQ